MGPESGGQWSKARGQSLTEPSCTGPPQIEFVFDPLEAAWEQSYKELCLVSDANGGVAHVSTLDPGRQILGVWCMHQARAHPPPHNSLERKFFFGSLLVRIHHIIWMS